jgi:two-component sensor histidine kinase
MKNEIQKIIEQTQKNFPDSKIKIREVEEKYITVTQLREKAKSLKDANNLTFKEIAKAIDDSLFHSYSRQAISQAFKAEDGRGLNILCSFIMLVTKASIEIDQKSKPITYIKITE